MLSNDIAATGLGNQHDLVGRLCMEHREILSATLIGDADRSNRLRVAFAARLVIIGVGEVSRNVCEQGG
jgi:hypothetical protein